MSTILSPSRLAEIAARAVDRSQPIMRDDAAANKRHGLPAEFTVDWGAVGDFNMRSRADILALLAHEAALRALLRMALAAVQCGGGYRCHVCDSYCFVEPTCLCACEPSMSWTRDAVAAGLHEEAK